MINFKQKIILLGIIICGTGCNEIYSPKLDTATDALVVEGLITDSNGPFSIKLSKALSFSSASKKIPFYGAKLQIRDNHNVNYFLTETDPGNYLLPSNFKAIVGNSYTLFIQTKTDMYMSSPQKMLPPPSFDSIHGYVGDKEILFENLYHEQIKKNITGANILLNFKNDSTGTVPKYRFKNTVLIEWYGFFPKYPTKEPVYCWQILPIDSKETLVVSKQTITGSETKNFSLCFLPNDKFYYEITDTFSKIQSLVITTQQYNLNEDSYAFYKGTNIQLDSNGDIFDPIASQLNGNIKCTNNPDKLVFGFFEVSSTTSKTFLIKIDLSGKKVEFKPALKLNDNIPPDGISYQIHGFWHG